MCAAWWRDSSTMTAHSDWPAGGTAEGRAWDLQWCPTELPTIQCRHVRHHSRLDPLPSPTNEQKADHVCRGSYGLGVSYGYAAAETGREARHTTPVQKRYAASAWQGDGWPDSVPHSGPSLATRPQDTAHTPQDSTPGHTARQSRIGSKSRTRSAPLREPEPTRRPRPPKGEGKE